MYLVLLLVKMWGCMDVELRDAVLFNDINRVEKRIKELEVSTINAFDYDGRTILTVALNQKKHCIQIIELLLKYKADVNLLDDIRLKSPLQIACSYSTPEAIEIIKLLLKHGANIESKDQRGIRPLHYAVTSATNSYDVVQLLLDNHANINAQTEGARNIALHFAVNCANENICDLLLNYDPKRIQSMFLLNARNKSPFSIATERNLKPILKVFYKYILNDLWILQSYIFQKYIQWLPEELLFGDLIHYLLQRNIKFY